MIPGKTARKIQKCNLWIRSYGASIYKDGKSSFNTWDSSICNWAKSKDRFFPFLTLTFIFTSCLPRCSLLHFLSLSLWFTSPASSRNDNLWLPASHALGKTVDELGLKNLPKELHPLGEALPKTIFSMMIPEIVEAITKKGIASVVIFGIEVSSVYQRRGDSANLVRCS